MFFDENDNFINPYTNGSFKAAYNDTFIVTCPLNGFRSSELSTKDSWKVQ